MKSKNPSEKMAEVLAELKDSIMEIIEHTNAGHDYTASELESEYLPKVVRAEEALAAYESSGKMWVDGVRSQEVLDILAANSCPRTYDVKAWDDCPYESDGHTQTDAPNVCEDCWLAYLRREEEENDSE